MDPLYRRDGSTIQEGWIHYTRRYRRDRSTIQEVQRRDGSTILEGWIHCTGDTGGMDPLYWRNRRDGLPYFVTGSNPE